MARLPDRGRSSGLDGRLYHGPAIVCAPHHSPHVRARAVSYETIEATTTVSTSEVAVLCRNCSHLHDRPELPNEKEISHGWGRWQSPLLSFNQGPWLHRLVMRLN
jgi:hypothetical protein